MSGWIVCSVLLLIQADFGIMVCLLCFFFFFFQAEDGIRDIGVTGVQTCALPILFLALDHDAAFIVEGALASLPINAATLFRSEERRVGKECRSRWWPYD